MFYTGLNPLGFPSLNVSPRTCRFTSCVTLSGDCSRNTDCISAETEQHSLFGLPLKPVASELTYFYLSAGGRFTATPDMLISPASDDQLSSSRPPPRLVGRHPFSCIFWHGWRLCDTFKPSNGRGACPYQIWNKIPNTAISDCFATCCIF